MADEPSRQKAAIRPAGQREAAGVCEPPFFYRRNARHDVACGSIRGIAKERKLKTIAQIIAASIVGFEDDVAVRRKILRQARIVGIEGGLRRISRPTVQLQHERVAPALDKSGRIREHAVFLKAVWSGPADALDSAQLDRREVAVEVRELSQTRRWGVQIE